MNKILFAAVSSAFVTIATQAGAADLNYKAPAAAAPIPYTWSGFYIGGTVGYSWNRLTINDVDFYDGLGDNSQSNSGFIGGGTIGYNWQYRGLVTGIEGDFSGMSNHSTVAGNDAPPPPTANMVSKINSLGTLRGRLGIAVDPAVLYVTGGAAFGHVNNQFADHFNAPFPAWNDNGWRAGWIFGGGLEAKWDANWSWKLEALYYQLQDNTVTINVPNQGNLAERQKFTDQGLIARVGLNYAFH